MADPKTFAGHDIYLCATAKTCTPYVKPVPEDGAGAATAAALAATRGGVDVRRTHVKAAAEPLHRLAACDIYCIRWR